VAEFNPQNEPKELFERTVIPRVADYTDELSKTARRDRRSRVHACWSREKISELLQVFRVRPMKITRDEARRSLSKLSISRYRGGNTISRNNLAGKSD